MKKIFAGMTAAALSLTMVMSASAATYLFDVVHPDDNDKEMNDSYYKIGAMGYFMSQKWTWNEYDWVGIDADGVIDISITVDEAKADKVLVFKKIRRKGFQKLNGHRQKLSKIRIDAIA